MTNICINRALSHIDKVLSFVKSTVFARNHIAAALYVIIAIFNGSISNAQAPNRPEVILSVKWGDGAHELSIRRTPQGLIFGPNSYDIGVNGNIYILDPAQQLIKVYSRNGSLIESHPTNLSGKIGFIDVDESSNIWISDPQDFVVLLYSETGELLKRFQYGAGPKALVEPFISVRDGAVYLGISRIDVSHVLFESGNFGETVYQAKRKSMRMSDRITIQGEISGRKYLPSHKENEPPELTIYDRGRVVRKLEFEHVDASFSVQFLKEDLHGNTFLKLSSIFKNMTQIWKFNSNFECVDKIMYFPEPESINFAYFNELKIDNSGNIYLMRLKNDGLKLLKWNAR